MTDRHSPEYWRERADELRLMSQLFPSQKSKDAIREVAACFDELASIAPVDLARIIRLWDENRRSDAVQILLDAPFFKGDK